jgi:hypothetical protein
MSVFRSNNETWTVEMDWDVKEISDRMSLSPKNPFFIFSLFFFLFKIQVPIDDLLNPPPQTKNHSPKRAITTTSSFYDPLRTIHILPKVDTESDIASVLSQSLKLPLVLLLPPTLLFATAKVEVNHPLLALWSVIRSSSDSYASATSSSTMVLVVWCDRRMEEGCHLWGHQENVKLLKCYLFRLNERLGNNRLFLS